MEVTYDYYRIFYYAAKYKSFSQAATILMSNQPNVTRAIHNLESQLGCRLFIIRPGFCGNGNHSSVRTERSNDIPTTTTGRNRPSAFKNIP